MRQNGYYWVRDNDEWYIAEWKYNSYWVVTGSDDEFSDSEFDEIDENQIVR